ncbi:MAG: hypothetical protein CMP51_06010 [Flavobacteriales bacterium]|nr:hypothetical protein [Flavobacteriales bacterium]
MKVFENILTTVLTVLFLGWMSYYWYYYKPKCIEKAEQKRIENAEIEKRTTRVNVVHDYDPKTNTYPVTITASANDPDGDEVDFKWSTKDKITLVRGTTTTSPSISFDAEPGSYKVKLTTTDNYGSSCEDYIIVEVGDEPNECPTPNINYSSVETIIEIADSTVTE